MKQEEQLRILSNEIEVRREKFYERNEDTLMEDFFRLKVLCDCFEAITGEVKFSYNEFKNPIFDDEFVSFFINELNTKKNDVIVEEKQLAKEELLFNPVLTNLYTMIEDYYNKLKERSDIPEGNYKRWYIDKLITNIPDRKLSEEEFENIVNMYLEHINYKYSYIYKKMKNEGKIFFLDGEFKSSINYGGACNGVDYDYEEPYDVIVVKRCNNDLETIVNLVHEIAHTIEFLELREEVSKEEFLKFRFTTQYGEIKAGIYELKCCDFLEDLGFPEDEIDRIRTKKMIEHMDMLKRFIADIYSDNSSYTENFNHDLEYAYLAFASVYFANINDEEFVNTMNKYDKEKINTRGFSIFEKIGCDRKAIEETTAKQLKKCM